MMAKVRAAAGKAKGKGKGKAKAKGQMMSRLAAKAEEKRVMMSLMAACAVPYSRVQYGALRWVQYSALRYATLFCTALAQQCPPETPGHAWFLSPQAYGGYMLKFALPTGTIDSMLRKYGVMVALSDEEWACVVLRSIRDRWGEDWGGDSFRSGCDLDVAEIWAGFRNKRV